MKILDIKFDRGFVADDGNDSCTIDFTFDHRDIVLLNVKDTQVPWTSYQFEDNENKVFHTKGIIRFDDGERDDMYAYFIELGNGAQDSKNLAVLYKFLDDNYFEYYGGLHWILGTFADNNSDRVWRCAANLHFEITDPFILYNEDGSEFYKEIDKDKFGDVFSAALVDYLDIR